MAGGLKGNPRDVAEKGKKLGMADTTELVTSSLFGRAQCWGLGFDAWSYSCTLFWGVADQVELMLQLADDKKVLKQLEDDPHVKTLDD